MSATLKKRPIAGSATGRVWAIADELLARTGEMPRGRTVVDEYLREDPSHNEGTGFTQYSHWKKAHLAQFKRAGPGPRPQETLQLGQDGKLALPLDIMRAMDIGPGEKFSARVTDGELRLVPARLALDRARALIVAFDTGTGSPVDELIEERRREGRE